MKCLYILALFLSAYVTKVESSETDFKSWSEILDNLPELPACSGFEDSIFRKIWNQHRNKSEASNTCSKSKTNQEGFEHIEIVVLHRRRM